MVEVKSLALGNGETYEKILYKNFDDPKEKSELVTGTYFQCFLQMWLLAPVTR
jgi:hypothetical protein